MKFIDTFNDFSDLMTNEPLPQAAQLLYYKLLNIWNRCGRKDWFFATNQRLMYEIITSSNHTLIRNRDKLIEVGLIDFKPGQKGRPSKYKIKKNTVLLRHHKRHYKQHHKRHSIRHGIRHYKRHSYRRKRKEEE